MKSKQEIEAAIGILIRRARSVSDRKIVADIGASIDALCWASGMQCGDLDGSDFDRFLQELKVAESVELPVAIANQMQVMAPHLEEFCRLTFEMDNS